MAAVNRAAKMSNIPTVQVDYSSFMFERPEMDNSTADSPQLDNETLIVEPSIVVPALTNYVTIVPATTVMFSVLKELFQDIHWAELTVLYDELYRKKTIFFFDF